MAGGLAAASFAYRLKGYPRYEAAKEFPLALARFPKGGVASPEYHGAQRKWSTQITELLAVCYDLWCHELTEEERGRMLDSIRWRLEATFYQKQSWRSQETIAGSGTAIFCQSHPYENFMWSLPGGLPTVGGMCGCHTPPATGVCADAIPRHRDAAAASRSAPGAPTPSGTTSNSGE